MVMDINKKLNQARVRMKSQFISSVKPYYLENC
jgi:hypothetical protein